MLKTNNAISMVQTERIEHDRLEIQGLVCDERGGITVVSTGYLLLLLMPVALQLVGLSFVVWSDPFIRREHRRLMLIIVLLIVSLILQNLADYYMAAGVKFRSTGKYPRILDDFYHCL